MNNQINHTYMSLKEWADQESIFFNPNQKPSFNKAVDQVLHSLSPSTEVLGFGEPYHVMGGDERFLKMRNELFKRLVEEHGYRSIAIESSFVKSSVINDYIQGGEGSFDTVKEAGLRYEFCNYETTRELVEWMREYNADPAHPVKLHFYGFDAPTEMTKTDSPWQVLNIVLDYLIRNNLADESLKSRIHELIGDDAKWESMDALMDASKSIGQSKEVKQLRLECELLVTLLELNYPALVNTSDKTKYHYIYHIASIARRLLNYHAAMAEESDQRLSILLGIRDAIMASNVQYILEAEKGRGKLFAHAHNRHLQYGSVEWQLGPHFNKWWPAGAHLKQTLGNKYTIIGAALYTSDIEGIGQPEDTSLEAILSSDSPLFIPTQQGNGLPESEIAKLEMRSVGNNPSYMPLDTKSFADFDWLTTL